MAKLDLVGTHEIEIRHGIPRYRVARFLKRELWPKPVADLKCGWIFDATAVKQAVERLRHNGQL